MCYGVKYECVVRHLGNGTLCERCKASNTKAFRRHHKTQRQNGVHSDVKKKEIKPDVVTESVVEQEVFDKNVNKNGDDDDNDVVVDDDDDDDNNNDDDDNDNNNDIDDSIQGNSNNGISSKSELHRSVDNKAHLRLRIIGLLEFVVR